MRLPRRLLLAAVTIGALVGGGAVGILTAGPAAAADCDVAVVVDFSGLPNGPGATRYGCADQPGSGLDALGQAGFTASVGATEQGNVVCDIDGAPGTDCAEGGLWAYWFIPPDSAGWRSLEPGSAESRIPDRGSVEGWTYQPHPDTPPVPPASDGPPGSTDPGTPTADPTSPPAEDPSTSLPTASASTGVPPEGSTPGDGNGSVPGPGDGPAASPSVQPSGLGGPGGGTNTGQPPGGESSGDADGTSPADSATSATGTASGTGAGSLSSSGVLGIGGGSPSDRTLTGAMTVAGLGIDEPLIKASPWTLIAFGAALAAGSAALAYLRHRRRTSDIGSRHA